MNDAFNNSKYGLMSEYFFSNLQKLVPNHSLSFFFLEIEANVKNFPNVSSPLNLRLLAQNGIWVKYLA